MERLGNEQKGARKEEVALRSWNIHPPFWPHSVSDRGHHLAKVFQASRGHQSERRHNWEDLFHQQLQIVCYGSHLFVKYVQVGGSWSALMQVTDILLLTPLKQKSHNACLRYTMPLRSGALDFSPAATTFSKKLLDLVLLPCQGQLYYCLCNSPQLLQGH